MAKSLGALEIVLLGDKALGTCSKVTAVGRIRAERRTTAKPWGPWKAQQLPGCTSGWRGWEACQNRASNPAVADRDRPSPTVFRVPTCRMTRGDWEWYHRGMPKRLRRAVLVS